MSGFRQRKFEAIFDVFDADRDGAVALGDFHAIGGHFGEQGGADHNTMHQEFEFWWNGVASVGGQSPDQMSKAEFAAAMDTLDETFGARLAQLAGEIAKAMDSEGTGSLSAETYHQMYAIAGIPAEVADVAFRDLDTDGDGRVAITDFIAGVHDFVNGDNPQGAGARILGEV